jgi:hypothetical protein
MGRTYELARWLSWKWRKHISNEQWRAMAATPGPLIAGQADG